MERQRGGLIKLLLLLLLSFSVVSFASESSEGSEGGEGKPKEEEAQHEEITHHEGYEQIRVQQSLRTTLIPKVLSEEMEKKFRLENPEKDVIPRAFLRVETLLTKENGEALEKNYEVISPMGGGTMDLATIVRDEIGSFKLQINLFKEHNEPMENLKVYAISQAKARQIEGAKWGDGCFRVYDITKHFVKDMKKGWTLYTKDQRYLSVLGGTLLFVSQDRKGIALAAMTFLDSRYKHLTCFPQTKSE